MTTFMVVVLVVGLAGSAYFIWSGDRPDDDDL